MTEEHRKKLAWTKPCRGFMIIAYDKTDPSKVYGYNPKQATFNWGQGYVYTRRGKQESNMLDNIIKEVKSIKSWPSKWIKRQRKENDTRPRTNIGSYFSFRRHLNRHLELKIIRISSDNCEYLATGVVQGSWWPMVYIERRENVIQRFISAGKSEADAIHVHHHYLRKQYEAGMNY